MRTFSQPLEGAVKIATRPKEERDDGESVSHSSETSSANWKFASDYCGVVEPCR